MVFIRGYSCRAKPDSCRGACREPKVGTARRRLTKVDGAGMSNGSRIACNSTFKSKRRRAVPAAKPLGKPPRFVVARQRQTCRHRSCSERFLPDEKNQIDEETREPDDPEGTGDGAGRTRVPETESKDPDRKR